LQFAWPHGEGDACCWCVQGPGASLPLTGTFGPTCVQPVKMRPCRRCTSGACKVSRAAAGRPARRAARLGPHGACREVAQLKQRLRGHGRGHRRALGGPAARIEDGGRVRQQQQRLGAHLRRQQRGRRILARPARSGTPRRASGDRGNMTGLWNIAAARPGHCGRVCGWRQRLCPSPAIIWAAPLARSPPSRKLESTCPLDQSLKGSITDLQSHALTAPCEE